MPKVNDIKILNVDNVEYAVDDLSDACKHLVATYNEWNQKEADARDNLFILQSAKENLSRQIINQIRAELAQENAKEVDIVDETVTEKADADAE